MGSEVTGDLFFRYTGTELLADLRGHLEENCAAHLERNFVRIVQRIEQGRILAVARDEYRLVAVNQFGSSAAKLTNRGCLHGCVNVSVHRRMPALPHPSTSTIRRRRIDLRAW